MKVYLTGNCNWVLFFLLVSTVFGIFWIIGVLRHMPDGWYGYIILISGSLIFACVVIFLLFLPVSLELDNSGILSIHALAKKLKRIRVSAITRVVLKGPPYVGLSPTNWEGSGGDMIIEYEMQQTRLTRFSGDEDLISRMTLNNSSIEIVRLEGDE